MLQPLLTGGTCGSAKLRKNGRCNGQPKYRCKTCRDQAQSALAAARKAAQYAQVEKRLVARVSQRAIVCLTGAAHHPQIGKKGSVHRVVTAQACAARSIEANITRNRRATGWQTDDDSFFAP